MKYEKYANRNNCNNNLGCMDSLQTGNRFDELRRTWLAHNSEQSKFSTIEVVRIAAGNTGSNYESGNPNTNNKQIKKKDVP